jgi:hypothetical protein
MISATLLFIPLFFFFLFLSSCVQEKFPNNHPNLLLSIFSSFSCCFIFEGKLIKKKTKRGLKGPCRSSRFVPYD